MHASVCSGITGTSDLLLVTMKIEIAMTQTCSHRRSGGALCGFKRGRCDCKLCAVFTLWAVYLIICRSGVMTDMHSPERNAIFTPHLIHTTLVLPGVKSMIEEQGRYTYTPGRRESCVVLGMLGVLEPMLRQRGLNSLYAEGTLPGVAVCIQTTSTTSNRRHDGCQVKRLV